MRTINKIIDWCILVLAAIAGVVLLFMLLAICFSTVTRKLFNMPFAFLIDYASYSLLYIAFLGAPWLLSRRGHINIDLVINAMKPGFRRYWQVGLDIVLAFTCMVVAVISFIITKTNFVNGVIISDFLSTPQWVLMICVPLGSFFTAVEAIRLAIRGLIQKPAEAEGKEAQA